ncbi:N-acyl-D-glucosamine 2-epimerase [Paenibacillus filicis]|uniref:N-acyl-D-glucosamine 2-epimerase n=1 Tax=Paenibacillus filicis TaxID=669464 RepID=A0ABU9DHX0_9BACL
MHSPLSAQATIQIDPTFSYYTDRSAHSVAAELAQAGYTAVRYFVTDESQVDGKLVHALRHRGLDVWAMVLGNGSYTSAPLPSGWEAWQMELVKPVNDGYLRLSPFHPGYVAWKKTSLTRLISRFPFTGVEVAECYFPEWNGLSSGVYGDIGPQAQAAFRSFGGSQLPEFRLTSSPRYYKKDPVRYALWVECRVDAVNRFVHELINGAGGVRDARPDIRVATWSVAVNAGPDAADIVRELQGLDAVAMIRLVQPDAHVLQTHWPDWMRSRLPADYTRRYEPFASPIRHAFPSLPLGLQTDSGSLKRMRRSSAWLQDFATEAGRLGYSFWTAYEYSIGRWMYDEPPLPLRAVRLSSDRLRVEFNKRIDEASAEKASYFIVEGRDREAYGSPPDLRTASARLFTPRQAASAGQQIVPPKVETDGQLLELQSDAWPAGEFDLGLDGIRDTPERWLLKGMASHTTPPGYRVRVPGWIG